MLVSRLLKKLDAWLGPPLSHLLPLPSGRVPDNPRAICCIRPGGIGDAALLAPAIICLRERFPAARITVLAERRNAAVFRMIPQVATTWCYDRPAELLSFFRQQYDILIDSEQYYRLSAVVARLARTAMRIGFDTNERRRLLSHRVPYSHDDYETKSFLRLLAPLGMDTLTPPAPPFLSIPKSAADRADTLLAQLGASRFACIFPGASIPERRWGTDRFRPVAKFFTSQNIGVVVVGGTADREQGEAIIHDAAPTLNLAGRTSLVETAAVLARSALLVGGDSGILHLAVGLDVPTVSLFGPGIPKKWAPRGKHHIVINKDLPCSPCTRFGTTPPCPRNAACLQAITPAEVQEAAARLLAIPS